VAETVPLLKKWSSQRRKTATVNDSGNSKMAVLLDHQYTQSGLTRDVLKGLDRARSDILFTAAREAGCDASLALVTYWESGSAEPTDYGYGYRRRRRYRGYDDDQGDDEAGQHVMGEVLDSSLSAEHFSDAEGAPLSFGCIPLSDDELVARQPLKAGEPDKEDFEGYTGNAGMTLDRWYYRAAVVIWPAELRFDVLCEAGIEAAVSGLEQMIGRYQKAALEDQAALKSSCLEFASRIIARWPERRFWSRFHSFSTYGSGSPADEEDFDDDEDEYDDDDDFNNEEYVQEDDNFVEQGAIRASGAAEASPMADRGPPRSFLSLLSDLGDAALISAWIPGVLARDSSVDPGTILGDLCAQYGWSTFQDELRQLFDRTDNETIERDARLLADFALRKDKTAERRELCMMLAQRLMAALEQWDPQAAKRDWQARTVDLRALLSPLTKTLLVLEEASLVERLATFVLDRPKSFDWTTVQVPALVDLEPWLKRNVKHAVAPLYHWLNAIVAELETRVSNPPQEPANWSRGSATGCNCADCRS
jgi:hypothetical protein